MDNTSVSKGIFPYEGAYQIGYKRKNVALPNYCDDPWYISYNSAWARIQNAAEGIRSNMFQQILDDLDYFVSATKETPLESLDGEIHTAIVLTGINVPDHVEMFSRIVSKLQPISKHIAVLWNRDSNNIKNIVEETIFQIISPENMDESVEIKKSDCNMRALKLWYQEYCEPEDPLIIIITDFESSSPTVLRDFILILSSYSNAIKFILIFGVATTLHAIHRSLTYDVTSKLNVQVFHTQTQVSILSDVLENIVFSYEIPFKLTGRAFQLLTDIFLFYDFSVENFLQSYKICMIQHFHGNNVASLCCHPLEIESRISILIDEDYEELRQVPSIANYIEQLQIEAGYNEPPDNEQMKGILFKLLKEYHRYMRRFLRVLKCLHHLMSTLPNAPMGKQLREFYMRAVNVNDLKDCREYKECLQLLSFLSKQELLSKLKYIISAIEISQNSGMIKVKLDLQAHIERIEEASLEEPVVPSDVLGSGEKLSRLQLKERLLKMSKMHPRSPYKQAQLDVINYLDQNVFSVYLVNPNRIAAHEIFCFSDASLAKQHIRGSLRAAIHTGLNDPQVYLSCECCKLENDEAIPPTLPDLSIIYKLHLESRKLINMYDWLQAFLIITNPESDDTEQRNVAPQLQARFTQAVAELEFLGFIKSSRKKRDHVKRIM